MTDEVTGHMGQVSGLKKITQRQKETRAEWGSPVPDFFLGDGEKAVVRFLTTGDEGDFHIATALFHEFKAQTATGTVSEERYCSGSEDLSCELCDGGDKKRVERFGVWLWVDRIYRNKQTKRAEQDSSQKYPKVKLPTGEIMFKQVVNGPQFWKRGLGHGQQLWNTIVAYFSRDGSLMAREYEISRRGAKLDTVYSILPNDVKTDPTPHQLEVKASLPKAFEVLAGRARWPEVSVGDIVDDDEPVEDEGVTTIPVVAEPPAAPPAAQAPSTIVPPDKEAPQPQAVPASPQAPPQPEEVILDDDAVDDDGEPIEEEQLFGSQ